jgi:hypothetical protein
MTDPELLDLLAAHFAVIEGPPIPGDWQPGPVGMTVRVGRAYLSEAYPALLAVAPHPDGDGWRALAIVKQETHDGTNYYSLYRRKARTRSERCFPKKTTAQDACFIGFGFSRSWVNVCDTVKGMTMKRLSSGLPTVGEHLAFGRAVKDFELALHQMTTGTGDGLGAWRYKKTSQQARALLRAEEALSHLKSVMDDEICAILPRDDLSATQYYYGEEDPEAVKQRT